MLTGCSLSLQMTSRLSLHQRQVPVSGTRCVLKVLLTLTGTSSRGWAQNGGRSVFPRRSLCTLQMEATKVTRRAERDTSPILVWGPLTEKGIESRPGRWKHRRLRVTSIQLGLPPGWKETPWWDLSHNKPARHESAGPGLPLVYKWDIYRGKGWRQYDLLQSANSRCGKSPDHESGNLHHQLGSTTGLLLLCDICKSLSCSVLKQPQNSCFTYYSMLLFRIKKYSMRGNILGSKI